jgi:hypothetical protein
MTLPRAQKFVVLMARITMNMHLQDMIHGVRDRHIVKIDAGTGPKSTLGLVVTGVRVVSIVPVSKRSWNRAMWEKRLRGNLQ